MRLRVALTHVYAWPEVRRGGERYLHELACALADAGHDVSILSTAREAGRGRHLGVRTRYLRRHGRALSRWFPEVADEVAFGAQAFARLAARRIDVWHALGTADAAAAATLGRVRRMRSVYTDLGISERHWRERRSDHRLYENVVRHVDRYLCLSEHAAVGVQRDYGRRPLVLGGGVDLRRFRPANRRSPRPALLFTSNANEPRKNLVMLLDAVALLHRDHPDLELWLAGPGDPAPLLDAAPSGARAAAVRIGVGSLEEVSDLYARAWVTVLPSWSEAFGLVILESLASGTPAVALAGEGPGELVTPEVGATCVRTPEALAEACRHALELARSPGVADVCRAAAEPYDWRRGIVPRVEAVYTEGVAS